MPGKDYERAAEGTDRREREAASLLDTRRLVRAKDVAEYLNLPLQTVWKYARQGLIGGVVRVGRQIRFDPEKLREWVADGGQSFEGGWTKGPR